MYSRTISNLFHSSTPLFVLAIWVTACIRFVAAQATSELKPSYDFIIVGGSPIDWDFVTAPQAHLNDRTIQYHRGRCLGGSSVINGMAYVRGSSALYNRWEELGNQGWSWNDVYPYFQKVKTRQNNDSYTTHDASAYGDGPLAVSYGGWEPSTSVAFIEACSSIGVPLVNDLNDGSGIGVKQGMITANKEFQRSSAYNAYYTPVSNRTNLTVRPLASVQSLLMGSNGNATVAKGVAVFDHVDASPYVVMASKEIILSAGFIQTPQLLMTAVCDTASHKEDKYANIFCTQGIGPPEMLKAVGVPVLVANENVGQNLQDSNLFSVKVHTRNGTGIQLALLDPIELQKNLAQYRANKTGPLTSPGGFTNAFQKLNTTEIADLGAHYIVNENRMDQAHVQYSYTGAFYPMNVFGNYFAMPNQDYFSVSATLLAPASRGSIKIGSAMATDPPIIDLNFYAEDIDRRISIQAFKNMRQLISQPAFADFSIGPNNGEVSPGAAVQTDNEIWK
ncbi:MAG: hypothetical protein Q9227_003165 [Pyrenula ochraceoflavens]